MNKIQAGIENAPFAGDSGVFYPRMFCGDEEAWKKALEDAEYMADAALDIAVLGRKASGLPDDGNYGPVGTVRTIKQAGYEYLYYVDRMGDWNSIAFRVVEMEGMEN